MIVESFRNITGINAKILKRLHQDCTKKGLTIVSPFLSQKFIYFLYGGTLMIWQHVLIYIHGGDNISVP